MVFGRHGVQIIAEAQSAALKEGERLNARAAAPAFHKLSMFPPLAKRGSLPVAVTTMGNIRLSHALLSTAGRDYVLDDPVLSV
jgi:hypothetical protein